ncbi:MAG: hypothetical protein GC186_16310 [Rhodobacteraceae bacterium]|nr:hypothetical protein [Paracoccaceae bacterium]
MTDDETVDELFRMAGRCLGQWSAIEYALADLFLSLHGQKPYANNKLRAVFETVQSLDIRLAMLKVSAELSMNDDQGFQESYKKLHEKIRESSRKRNQTAHFALVRTEGRARDKIRLHPFYTPSGSYNGTNKDGLSIKQLQEMRASFVILNDCAIYLSWYVQIRLGIAIPAVQNLANPERLIHTQPTFTAEELASLPQNRP